MKPAPLHPQVLRGVEAALQNMLVREKARVWVAGPEQLEPRGGAAAVPATADEIDCTLELLSMNQVGRRARAFGDSAGLQRRRNVLEGFGWTLSERGWRAPAGCTLFRTEHAAGAGGVNVDSMLASW